MRIGQLRRRLRFDALVRVDDGAGGYTEDWAAVVSGVPAAIDGLSSQERVIAMREGGQVTHRITVRYRSDLHSSMRAIDEESEQVYNIDPPVDPDGRRKWLEMTARGEQ